MFPSPLFLWVSPTTVSPLTHFSKICSSHPRLRFSSHSYLVFSQKMNSTHFNWQICVSALYKSICLELLHKPKSAWFVELPYFLLKVSASLDGMLSLIFLSSHGAIFHPLDSFFLKLFLQDLLGQSSNGS